MIGIYIHIMERGIKGVPRKIEDFSGCFKGVRLINNLVNVNLTFLPLETLKFRNW